MKKSLALASLILGLILFSNTGTLAQSNFDVGGGLIYGSEVEAIGIQAGAKYGFTEKLSGTGDFAFYFPENYDWWTINVNANYHFYAQDNVGVYGLGGLNYATVKIDLGQFGSASNSEVGLNLGAGAEFGLDFAKLYGELKYIVGNADQLAFSAGLRFPL